MLTVHLPLHPNTSTDAVRAWTHTCMMAFGTAVSTPSICTAATKAACRAGVHTMRGRLRPAGPSGPSLPGHRAHWYAKECRL